MASDVIKTIHTIDNKNLDILFKPVQLRIIKKLAVGRPLTENEKRYLRGNLGKKLRMLQALIDAPSTQENHLYEFLRAIREYYITGYEALKHNGFGWYFDPKRIIVMNTRLEGTFRVDDRIIIFRRVKSLGKNGWKTDPDSGLRYATNERILHDAVSSRQTDLIEVCVDLLERYGKLFVPRPQKYQQFMRRRITVGRPEDFSE